MAVIKANYVKRGTGDRGRAKATIRYITHRRDRDGHTVTRDLFSFDGSLTKAHVYRMIDTAPAKGTYFYRLVISPDPKREDRYHDLSLSEIAIDTMLRLEERLGKQIQFVGTIHDDHSPHRHVHTLVILQGKRLTREDFAALRQEATGRALAQRRFRDRLRGYHLYKSRSRPPLQRRASTNGPVYRSTPPYASYTCPLCGYHQALPPGRGYRCPADGLYLRRERRFDMSRTQRREVGLELSRSP